MGTQFEQLEATVWTTSAFASLREAVGNHLGLKPPGGQIQDWSTKVRSTTLGRLRLGYAAEVPRLSRWEEPQRDALHLDLS